MPALINDKRFIFVSFGVARADMYNIKGETFTSKPIKKRWGTGLVFGILIHAKNPFDVRILDGMYSCSKSILYKNHKLDKNHREKISVYPLSFKNLEEFCDLKYTFSEKVTAEIYMINETEENIAIIKKKDKRISDGLNKVAFVKAYNNLMLNNKK